MKGTSLSFEVKNNVFNINFALAVRNKNLILLHSNSTLNCCGQTDNYVWGSKQVFLKLDSFPTIKLQI